MTSGTRGSAEAGLCAGWLAEAGLAPETGLPARPRLSWLPEARLALAAGTPTAFAREVESVSSARHCQFGMVVQIEVYRRALGATPMQEHCAPGRTFGLMLTTAAASIV